MNKKKIITLSIILIIFACLIPACFLHKKNTKKNNTDLKNQVAKTNIQNDKTNNAEHSIIDTQKELAQNESQKKSDTVIKKDPSEEETKIKEETSDEPEKRYVESVKDQKTTDEKTTITTEPDKKVSKPTENNGTTKEESNPSISVPEKDSSTTSALSPEPTQTPVKPSHSHTWVEQKETVHHDAETSLVWIIDQAAYDEPDYVEEFIYETIPKVQCRACGAEFDTYDQWLAHSDQNIDAGDYSHGSYSIVYHQILTGSQMIPTGTYTHHNEEGHWENQVVKAAYDEETVTGYKCSGCGATK